VGIYLDDESDGFHVYDNVVYRAAVGLLLHGSPNNVIDNNVFAYSRVADLWVHPETYNVAPMRNRLQHNIWYLGRGTLFKFIGSEPNKRRFWPKQPFEVLDYNVYWRGGEPLELGFDRGFDRHSLVADPLFMAPERGDFRLQPGSPTRRLGIRSIDLTGAGVRRQ